MSYTIRIYIRVSRVIVAIYRAHRSLPSRWCRQSQVVCHRGAVGIVTRLRFVRVCEFTRLQLYFVYRILFNENFACCVANRRDRGSTDLTRAAKAKRAQPKMCGGFTCSKNALTALNILYIVSEFCTVYIFCEK